MNQNTTMILVIAIAIFLTVKNFIQLKDAKKDRKFIDVYSLILNGDEEALDKIDAFINENISNALTNKGKVLKIYEELKRGLDPIETAKSIDFHCMFINEKSRYYDKREADRNCDVFVWLALVIAKCKKTNRKDIIDILSIKLEKEDSMLQTSLEYKLYKGLLKASNKIQDEDEQFLQDLIDGNYSGLSYEKRLIGLYKRIAAAYLDYEEKELDEYYKEDMKDFATKLIGRLLLDDLDLLKKYDVKEEIEEENKEEEK